MQIHQQQVPLQPLVGTSLAVDNVSVDANTISTTNSNGDLVLSPNGTGSVTVPSGYKNRSGFGANFTCFKRICRCSKSWT